VKLSSVVTALIVSSACLLSSCTGPTEAPKAAPEKAAVADAPAVEPSSPAPVKEATAKPAAEEMKVIEPVKEAAPAPKPEPVKVPPKTEPKPEPAPKPVATTKPTTAPASPPRVIITVGEAEIMSDRLDEALAKMPKDMSDDRRDQAIKRMYKRWIEDELITAKLAEMEVTDQELQAEREKLIGWLAERDMRNEYMRERAKVRAANRAARKAAESQPATSTTRPAAANEPAPETKPAIPMPKRPTPEQIEAKKQEVLASAEQSEKLVEQYLKSRRLDEQKMTSKFKYNVIIERAATPEKVEEFIKSYPVSFFDGTTAKASHILIATEFYEGPDARAAARKKLVDIAEKVKSGEITFEEAAKANSDCPSASRGGDLGEFQLSRMVPAFALAVDKLKPGEMSEPVETFFGWHIIKLAGKTEGSGTVSEQAKAMIPRMIKGNAHRQMLNESLKNNPVTIHE